MERPVLKQLKVSLKYSPQQLNTDCIISDGYEDVNCTSISERVPKNCKAYNILSGYYNNIFFNITLNSTSSSTNTSFESYKDFFFRKEYFDPYDSTHYISDQQLYVIFKNVNIHTSTKYYFDCWSRDFADGVIIFKPKDVSSIMIFPKIERNYIYYDYWSFRSYDETCYLNYAIKSLPKLNNEGNIQFGISASRKLTYETESFEHTFGNAIANLGGFYVALNSMYVLLFGMPKLSPCLKAKLAKRYVTSSGIVLAQRVSNRRNNATLENRVQMLETMLQDYYLDNYQFEASFLMMHLRRTDLKYDKFQCEYDEMINSRHQETEEERIFLAKENNDFWIHS
nr:4644_t:CDS:2 [Entrophospora candida]